MTPVYDDSNIFAKILRGEIPCNKVYEDDFALAFQDIAPQASIHVLVIPKGPYVSFNDFAATATSDEITGFFRAVQQVAEAQKVPDGYRMVSNYGADAGQEVLHFHVHILAGERLGPLNAKR